MAHLIKYGMMSATENGFAGYLVKAQCDLCGKKYGSVEEARRCENRHMNNILKNMDSFIKAVNKL